MDLLVRATAVNILDLFLNQKIFPVLRKQIRMFVIADKIKGYARPAGLEPATLRFEV